jgi:hypothetical protein
MAGMYEFFQSLTDTQWDSMVRVVQDLQDSTSVERLSSLRSFLSSLTKEIDMVNRRRDALGQKIENIDAAIAVLDSRIVENPQNMEAVLFRFILIMWRGQLKVDIADLRPSEKLEKKYDAERKRELLTQLQVLVSSLGVEMQDIQAERTEVRTEAKNR